MKSRSMQTFCVALSLIILFLLSPMLQAVDNADVGRERLLMDFGWRFAFGHPWDTKKDFNHGTGFFSYFAKTGNGDGAAAVKFDDSTCRMTGRWKPPLTSEAASVTEARPSAATFPKPALAGTEKHLIFPYPISVDEFRLNLMVFSAIRASGSTAITSAMNPAATPVSVTT